MGWPFILMGMKCHHFSEHCGIREASNEDLDRHIGLLGGIGQSEQSCGSGTLWKDGFSFCSVVELFVSWWSSISSTSWNLWHLCTVAGGFDMAQKEGRWTCSVKPISCAGQEEYQFRTQHWIPFRQLSGCCLGLVIFHHSEACSCFFLAWINGHFRILDWRYLPYIRPM
jgi:hypothetical protein